MKSAAAMSLEIRRKKKELRDNPEVVDLSGIPMDKTDEDVAEQNELTTDLGMDKNHAKMRDEEPSVMKDERVDASDDSHEEEEPLSKKIKMMANGGQVKPQREPAMFQMAKLEPEEGMRDLDKAEHGEGNEDHDEKKLKRMARIAKMMR